MGQKLRGVCSLGFQVWVNNVGSSATLVKARQASRQAGKRVYHRWHLRIERERARNDFFCLVHPIFFDREASQVKSSHESSGHGQRTIRSVHEKRNSQMQMCHSRHEVDTTPVLARDATVVICRSNSNSNSRAMQTSFSRIKPRYAIRCAMTCHAMPCHSLAIRDENSPNGQRLHHRHSHALPDTLPAALPDPAHIQSQHVLPALEP